jgi:TM2 domain-containing membrane protein YozV
MLIILLLSNVYSLKFAESLEKKGDYYRAITEYKRYLFDCPESDSIRYHVASMYAKNNMYGNAIDILREARNKDELYENTMGKYFYRVNYFDSCLNYWSDEKIGLVCLRRGEIENGMKLLNLKSPPEMKNPYLGVALSSILPGSGRMYAGRVGDGVFSMITFFTSTYLAYKNYKEDNYPLTVLFGGISGVFYGGNIFGTYISVKIYNSNKMDEYMGRVEKCILE